MRDWSLNYNKEVFSLLIRQLSIPSLKIQLESVKITILEVLQPTFNIEGDSIAKHEID